MSFLYPAMLGALAAVAIPIGIHLLNKFRVQIIDWAAMKFLADSLRKNERRLKFEDLLLLLLRCLIFALLALAFARPVLRAFAAGGEGSGPVAAVILLDNSGSMQQTGGAVNRFDEARQTIRQWLDKRDADSLFALFLVSNRTEPVVANLTPDVGLIRKELDAAKSGDRGSNLAQGIRQAYQTLASVTGRPREIRIYTDDQMPAWKGLEEIKRLARENPDIRLVPITVGDKAENNLGIVSLSVEGGVAAVNLPVRVRVEVANFGAVPAEGVRVSLLARGASLGETVIPSLAPGATQAVDVPVSFAEAGYQSLTAQIPSDPLTIDNERSLAVNVIRAMNVLIVEGGTSETVVDRDGYFLANALVPVSAEWSLRYYLGLTFASPATLNDAALAGADVVFLSNVGEVPAAAAKALRDYVSGGGNLVVFPGPLSDPALWKGDFLEMLPAEAGPLRMADGGITWQKADFEHPVTALWNDPAQGSLGSVRVLKYLPLTPKAAQANGASPSVVVRLSDGQPAGVEWTFGEGRVVLFNSTATPEWNNLPLHPAFVPFVQRLLGYLDRKNETRTALAPGEPFRLAVARDLRGKEFFVRLPDGSRRPAGRVEAEGEEQVIRFSDTQETGPYEISLGADERSIAAFAVQFDPSESDLRRLDATELQAVAESPTAQKTDAESAARLVVTREFWTNLIWIVAALAIVEMALAFRFSQAR